MTQPAKDGWRLWTDGGARGNPGPGALGYVLTDPAGNEVEARGEYLGPVTNNVAEYRGLIAGLGAAERHAASPLTVCMDSELIVRQMTGEYRVKNAGLKPLHEAAQRAAARLPSVRFQAVRREDNVRADQLVNETLDRIIDGSTSKKGIGSESPR